MWMGKHLIAKQDKKLEQRPTETRKRIPVAFHHSVFDSFHDSWSKAYIIHQMINRQLSATAV